ncbi:antitoxin MazE-like protein [Reyranella sp.]|uniref:antitoxin MazE-like protein n=1 Tax=Reyranella sp. TaxID=1929291 RepID=UPI0040352DAC
MPLETKHTSTKRAQAHACKASRHREALRAPRLTSIQVLLPNVRSTVFRKEAHRQSLAVARSDRARRDQAFIEAASNWNDE